jgi:hypothetical protein
VSGLSVEKPREPVYPTRKKLIEFARRGTNNSVQPFRIHRLAAICKEVEGDMNNLIRLRICAGSVIAVFVFAATLHGQQTPLPGPPDFTFGMVGLAPGQTARLNVVNIGSFGGATIPCRLVLGFLDANGKLLHQAFVQVDTGKAAFLDLISKETSERIQIRGIGYNPLLIPVPLSCSLVPTLEIFGPDSATTSVVLANWVRLNVTRPSVVAAGP